jgi:hypothetical protein
MATNIPVAVIEKQDWLEPIADRLQPTVVAALGVDGPIGPKAANILHGTWLGHPLHVVLTDVPLGSWTAAAVLDVLEEKTGSRAIRRGADAAIAVGVVGAAAAALTGLTVDRLVQDRWRPTSPHRSRARTSQCYRHSLLRYIAMSAACSLTARRAAIGLAWFDRFERRRLSGRTFSVQGKNRC